MTFRKTLSFKLTALSGFFCFESIVSTEYYSLNGYFHSKFPQKKSSPSSWVGASCSICQRISVLQMWSWHCDLHVQPCSLSASMLGSCPLPCKPFSVTLGPGGATHGCQVADFPQFPILIENKSFQLKIQCIFQLRDIFFYDYFFTFPCRSSVLFSEALLFTSYVSPAAIEWSPGRRNAESQAPILASCFRICFTPRLWGSVSTLKLGWKESAFPHTIWMFESDWTV